MLAHEMKIGGVVEAARDFANVPRGTRGVIVDDYGSGVTVAWDLDDRPLDWSASPDFLARLAASDPRCPLRDGFDKLREGCHLLAAD